MYVIGKTGTGKSTLLATLIRQDIESGRGVALLDPHGDLCEQVLRWVPESRKDDLIYGVPWHRRRAESYSGAVHICVWRIVVFPQKSVIRHTQEPSRRPPEIFLLGVALARESSSVMVRYKPCDVQFR
jgi:hypothetical protein